MSRLPFVSLAIVALCAALCLFFFGFTTLALVMAAGAVWFLFVSAMPGQSGILPKNQTVRLGPMKWDLQDFVRHWGIFGKSGCGKTLAAIKTLMIGFYRAFPNGGGVMIDEKGDFALLAKRVFSALGQSDKLILIQAPDSGDDRDPPVSINIIGDPSISWQDYADMIVAVAQSQGQRNEQSFFKTQARDRIAEAFRTLELAKLIPTIPAAYDFFARPSEQEDIIKRFGVQMTAAQELVDNEFDRLKEAGQIGHGRLLAEVAQLFPSLKPLYDRWREYVMMSEHWQAFMQKAGDEASGIRSSIQNYLRPYCAPGLSRTFSSIEVDTNIHFKLVDSGKVLVPSIPQSYISGRRYIMAFFKILYYVHGRRRYDAMAKGEPRGNPLVLWNDEGHGMLLQTEDGISDINSLDILRDAHCTVVLAMQDFASAIPPLGSQDKADVLFANLNNMVIFGMNTPKARKIAADIIGEEEQEERSLSFDHQSKRSRTISKRMKHIVPPIFFRRLPKFRAIVMHAEGRWAKTLLPPFTDDGSKVEPWFFRVYLLSALKNFFRVGN